MAINVTVTEEIVNVNVSVSTLANDIAAANALRAEQAANAAEGFKDDAEAAAIQTNADAIATAADRVQTGLDVIDTNADVVTVTNFSNLILASQNTAIIQDLGSIDGTVDIDLLDGTLVIADLTDAVVFTFSGLPDNDKETAFTLRLSGLEQITFPVGTKFANGEVPTPDGALYEIPCSIDSTGALIVYGVINDIKVP
jgi:hypothetical protein